MIEEIEIRKSLSKYLSTEFAENINLDTKDFTIHKIIKHSISYTTTTNIDIAGSIKTTYVESSSLPEVSRNEAREITIQRIKSLLSQERACFNHVMKYYNEDKSKVWSNSDFVFYADKQGCCTVDSCDKCNGSAKCECPRCSGSGYNVCTTCNGTKHESCTSCRGRGKKEEQVKCDLCHGEGHKDLSLCARCLGKGYKQKTYNCSSCSGSGKRTCYSCGGFGLSTCRCGSGKVKCDACNATGSRTVEYRAQLTASPTFSVSKPAISIDYLEPYLSSPYHKGIVERAIKFEEVVLESDNKIYSTQVIPIYFVRVTYKGKKDTIALAGRQLLPLNLSFLFSSFFDKVVNDSATAKGIDQLLDKYNSPVAKRVLKTINKDYFDDYSCQLVSKEQILSIRKNIEQAKEIVANDKYTFNVKSYLIIAAVIAAGMFVFTTIGVMYNGLLGGGQVSVGLPSLIFDISNVSERFDRFLTYLTDLRLLLVGVTVAGVVFVCLFATAFTSESLFKMDHRHNGTLILFAIYMLSSVIFYLTISLEKSSGASGLGTFAGYVFDCIITGLVLALPIIYWLHVDWKHKAKYDLFVSSR